MDFQKYTDEEIIMKIRHNLRKLPEHVKNPGNTAIKKELVTQNYSFVNRGNSPREVNAYRKELEKKLYKFGRKKTIHAIEFVIQAPKDCPEDQEKMFFRECYDYFVSLMPMGEDSVFLAEVHRDERFFAPDGRMISKNHLHLMFTPAARATTRAKQNGYEYKLCANDLTKRKQVLKWLPNLQRRLDKAGIQATVYTKRKKGGEKFINLTVEQMKEITTKTNIVLEGSITMSDFVKILDEHPEVEVLDNKLHQQVYIHRYKIEKQAERAKLEEEIKELEKQLDDDFTEEIEL